MPAWSSFARVNAFFVVARRLFAGRDGRIALTVVLALTAALEASLYTPDAYPEFTFEERGDPGLAILLNIVAVAPLLAAHRFPFLAAAGTTFVAVLLLAIPEAPITLTALGVLLYTVGHLVVRRGLLWAVPLLAPFLIHAVEPAGGGNAGPASVGPLLLVVAAVLLAESTRKRTEVVAALDATQEAMAESVREQTAMEERARIARELHDIVAHHLSVIAVQSETGRLTSPRSSPPTLVAASRRSRRPRATRSPRPAGCSEFCARTSAARPTVRRSRVSTSLPSSSTPRATPARTSGSSCKARSSHCPRASISPPTASSRRR